MGRLQGTGRGWLLLIAAAGVGGCNQGQSAPEPPAAATTPALPPPAADVTATTGADGEDSPAARYRGVAGFRAPQDGECPEGYKLVNDLCTHNRLLAARSPEELAVAMKAFIDGAVPPIVADAPPQAQQDPSDMEPGALQASEDELRRRRKGLSTRYTRQVTAREGNVGEAAAAPVLGSTGAPEQAQATGGHLLGGGLAGLSGPGGEQPGQISARSRRMIQQLEQITSDGTVDIGEAGTLFKMLGTQLEGMEIPPELLGAPTAKGSALRAR